MFIWIFSLSSIFFTAISFAEDPYMDMVLVKSGTYKPFFKQESGKEVIVSDFHLDKFPVSIMQFNKFLKENPDYQKTKILSIYKDERYLENWPSDLFPASKLNEMNQIPVTFVSWYVARKYCQWLGKRLPTITEWEYASDANDPEVIELILKWYAKSANDETLKIGRSYPNKKKLYDMHGLIWEWVEDFNTVMISPDSRAKGERADAMFCGGGSLNAEDAKQYATFMRFGFRSGLKGNYTMQSLGFRCAK